MDNLLMAGIIFIIPDDAFDTGKFLVKSSPYRILGKYLELFFGYFIREN